MKIRAYICERPAERSDGSEDSTAPSITSGQVETSASATTASCIARIEACTSRARGRIDEIEREINAVRTGNREVIDKMALGGPDAGSTWIGGSASIADLAQSAIDFGRSIEKLSTEVRSALLIGCFTLFRTMHRFVSLYIFLLRLFGWSNDLSKWLRKFKNPEVTTCPASTRLSTQTVD